jgi:hypothetical protein
LAEDNYHTIIPTVHFKMATTVYGSALQLTQLSLVSLTDEECQVLKHSSQWVETIDPTVAAMQAMINSNKEGSATCSKLS